MIEGMEMGWRVAPRERRWVRRGGRGRGVREGGREVSWSVETILCVSALGKIWERDGGKRSLWVFLSVNPLDFPSPAPLFVP